MCSVLCTLGRASVPTGARAPERCCPCFLGPGLGGFSKGKARARRGGQVLQTREVSAVVAKGWEAWGVTASGLLFQVTDMFWNEIVVTVAQICEYIKGIDFK